MVQNIRYRLLESIDKVNELSKDCKLDSASEMCFLFKIEFQKPNISVKAKIWNSKLPSLSVLKCETLASRFDFSGGQIDNIVRKNEIYEIINGISVDFSNIVDFCKTELLKKIVELE